MMTSRLHQPDHSAAEQETSSHPLSILRATVTGSAKSLTKRVPNMKTLLLTSIVISGTAYSAYLFRNAGPRAASGDSIVHGQATKDFDWPPKLNAPCLPNVHEVVLATSTDHNCPASSTSIRRSISLVLNPTAIGWRTPGKTTESYSSVTSVPSTRSQCDTVPVFRSITCKPH